MYFLAEAKKNEHATEILDKILNAATWLNIHQIVVRKK